MRLTEYLELIESKGKGVRAYQACSRALRESLKERSGHSIALFLLAAAADAFVEAYDDQPLLSQGAEDAFLRFKSYVERLSAIETEGSPNAVMDALNAVAHEIANQRLRVPAI